MDPVHSGCHKTLSGEGEQVGQPFARLVHDECRGCFWASVQKRFTHVGADLES